MSCLERGNSIAGQRRAKVQWLLGDFYGIQGQGLPHTEANCLCPLKLSRWIRFVCLVKLIVTWPGPFRILFTWSPVFCSIRSGGREISVINFKVKKWHESVCSAPLIKHSGGHNYILVIAIINSRFFRKFLLQSLFVFWNKLHMLRWHPLIFSLKKIIKLGGYIEL